MSASRPSKRLNVDRARCWPRALDVALGVALGRAGCSLERAREPGFVDGCAWAEPKGLAASS